MPLPGNGAFHLGERPIQSFGVLPSAAGKFGSSAAFAVDFWDNAANNAIGADFGAVFWGNHSHEDSGLVCSGAAEDDDAGELGFQVFGNGLNGFAVCLAEVGGD